MEVRLQNVVIPSDRLAETVAFYRDVLGLAVLTEGPGFCFLRAGSANIAIHQAIQDSDVSPTGRGIYLDMLVDDLVVAKAALESGAVGILREWSDDNGNFILVADPAGNFVEIYEASQTSDTGGMS